MDPENDIQELDFKPLPFLSSPHSQTILGSYGLPIRLPTSKEQLIPLEDGSKLCNKIFTPPNWKEPQGIVILLSGMGGSDQSHYIQRMTAELYQRGYSIYCFNRRGCGCGKGLSRKLGHGGKTDEILFVLKQLKQKYPNAPIQMIGFSIGGSLLLKLLGELGEKGGSYLLQGIVVCPLMDLRDTADTLEMKSNSLYRKYYINSLIKLVRAAEDAFPDEEKVQFPQVCTMHQYNRLYTLPKWGYQSAEAYYAENSAASFVSHIQVPCHILYAEDDPLIDYKTIEASPCSQNVKLRKTKQGGHMGFLGFTGHGLDFRWMDQQILRFLL